MMADGDGVKQTVEHWLRLKVIQCTQLWVVELPEIKIPFIRRALIRIFLPILQSAFRHEDDANREHNEITVSTDKNHGVYKESPSDS